MNMSVASEELMMRVREHKHNYAQDFGLVVSVPTKALFDEVICNPQVFTVEERERILTAYADSIACRACYDFLGLPLDVQLKRAKSSIVPTILADKALFQSLLREVRTFKDSLLAVKLNMALGEVDSLCDRLLHMEDIDYGSPESFNLRSAILEAFNQYNESEGLKGHSTIFLETHFAGHSDVSVHMNKDDFSHYVVGNIIKNLHDHAFKDMDEEDFDPSGSTLPAIQEPNRRGWLLKSLVRKRAYNPLFDVPISMNLPINEKKVHIEFRTDETQPGRLNVLIENNGKPFIGDLEKVFEEGVGEGTGVGLYSASQYLKHVGGSISMYVRDGEFKVGFLINIPIL